MEITTNEGVKLISNFLDKREIPYTFTGVTGRWVSLITLTYEDCKLLQSALKIMGVEVRNHPYISDVPEDKIELIVAEVGNSYNNPLGRFIAVGFNYSEGLYDS